MRSAIRFSASSARSKNHGSRRFIARHLTILSVLLGLCAAMVVANIGTVPTSASVEARESKGMDAQSRPPTESKAGTKSVSALLNANGTIKPGFDGAFDASGYQMLLGANGAPSFVPMSSGCTESWDNRFFSSGAEDVNGGEVNAIAVDGSDVYIGGSFTTVGAVTANRVAKWNGTSWSALGSASQNGVDSTVHAMAMIGTDLYVAGVFIVASDSTQLNISTQHLATWSTTSSTWSPLGNSSQNGADASVFALAVFGTDLYVGGSFNTTSSSTQLNMSAHRLAIWNSSAGTWSPLGGSTENGVDGQVNALALMETDLYVGGMFTTASDGTQPDISANHVAKWNGTSWSPLGDQSQNGVDLTVWALAVIGTDVYVAGEFATVSDVATANTPANSIARWDTTTDTWSLLGDPGANGIQAPIYALAVSGTELYVGGDFMSASDRTMSDKPTYRIARWSPLDETWSPLGNLSTRNGVNNQVKALLASGTDLFVGGQFTNFSSALQVSFSGNRIIRWDTTASSFSALANSSQKGVNNQVQAVAVNGTDVYIGGTFTSVGNVRANGLAKWDGSSWSSLGSSNQNGVNGTVTALLWNGELIVGGTFTTASSSTQQDISANHIVKWNTTSPGTWLVFGSAAQNGLSGTNATVNAIVQRGTSYYIGGTFTTASDSTQVNMSARNVVRWRTTNPNTWSPLGNAAQNGVDDTVLTVALGTDSDIYVGGLFGSASDSTQVNMAARYIARWNLAPNTPVWSPLGSATQNGVSDRVDAIAFSGSDLYAGGDFNTASSATQLNTSVTKIARWSMGSSTWSPLGTSLQNGLNDAVTAIAVRGSNLYVGGAFIAANDSTQTNMSANRIARWSLTSNTWSPLGSVENGVNSLVNDLAVSGGDVYVGGYFTTAGGLPSSHFAHWISNNNPPVITAGGPTTFCAGGNVTLTSSSATGNQWYLDGNPIGGATNQTYVASAAGNYAATTVDNGCTTDLSAATTVTLVPLSATPTITPGSATTFCTGGSVTLTSSSATDNQWYRGGVVIAAATSQTYIATVSGDYTVRATPGDCTSAPSAVTTVTVNAPPPTPTITPDGPTTFCAGGSVTLTSSSASGNQWYLDGNPIGGATNQAYVASASGSYTTTVTASGCPIATSAGTIVTVNPTPATPTITPGGPTTFCTGASVTLTSSSASGNQWYLNGNPVGGATNQTYVATASGNYTNIVTANGCPSAPSSAATVTVNPTPATPTITPGGPTTFCETGSVSLTSSSAGGNQWYLNGNPIGGETNQTYIATASGAYTNIVTASGCSSGPSAPTTVTVDPIPATPIITPAGPTTFCNGGDVTLTSSSASGNQWYKNGNPIAGATNQQYTATASGDYTNTVTTNGCTSAPSSATTVTVNPVPEIPTITPGGPTTFCEGGSVTLTSSSDSDSGSQWYLNGNPIGGATNQAYIATAAGDYTVTDTANGCSTCPSTATTVTVNPTPTTPTVTPGSPTTFCTNGSVTLTSSNPSGNQWYLNGNPIGGATNQAYIASASGNYTTTVTASGCPSAPSTATTVTVNPLPGTPTITPAEETTFCANGFVSLTSSSPSGNQWYLNGNPIGGATAQQYNAATAGDYSVTVTTLGCSSGPSAATTVTANTAPTLTYATPPSVTFGGSLNAAPTAASDNGTVTYQILAGHGLANAPTVSTNGTVSITNAQPAGAHTITIRATDDCGVTTDATSTLQVQSPGNVNGTNTMSGALVPGSSITYTVTLSNSSSSAQLDNAGNEFTDIISSSLTLVSATATNGSATTNMGTNTVDWNGGLAGNGSVTITITATINNVPEGTIVSNQGSINYDADGNGTNEASRLTDDPAVVGVSDPTNFTVDSKSDLTITKSHSGNFSAGQVGAAYTIAVTNTGTGATSGVVTVTDAVPVGLTPTGPNGAFNGWSCAINGQTLTCTRSDMLAGSGASYPAISLIVTVANAAPLHVTNTATVSGGGEVNTNNNTASDPTTINCSANFAQNNGSALMISRFRENGPAGPQDEFVEIFNPTQTPHTVASGTCDGGGYGIYASAGNGTTSDTATLVCYLPNGTVIPAGGYYLCTGVTYSLGNLGRNGGDAGATSTGDAPIGCGGTCGANIPDDAGLALVNKSAPTLPGGFGIVEFGDVFYDKVGFGPYGPGATANGYPFQAPTYCEGGAAGCLKPVGDAGTGAACADPSGLFPVFPAAPACYGLAGQYEFLRRQITFDANQGTVHQDTNNNGNDFILVAPNPATNMGVAVTGVSGVTAVLGSAAPHNRQAPPDMPAVKLTRSSFDGTNQFGPRNLERRFIPDLTVANPANNPLGTATFRFRFTNNLGIPINGMRIQVDNLSTPCGPQSSTAATTTVGTGAAQNVGSTPDCGTGSFTAILKALNSTSEFVVDNDGTARFVNGTVLEDLSVGQMPTPPGSPPLSPNGGGLDSAFVINPSSANTSVGDGVTGGVGNFATTIGTSGASQVIRVQVKFGVVRGGRIILLLVPMAKPAPAP